MIVEFLQIQIPADRTSGTRTRTTQMLSNTFVEICLTPFAPRRLLFHATIVSLHEPELEHLSGFNQKAHAAEIWDRYSVPREQAELLEERPRSRHACQLWEEHRVGRISGSKAHHVLTKLCGKYPSKSSTIEKLVSDLMRYHHYDLSRNSAVSWGLKNEDKARTACVAFMNNTHGHENISCHPCGFQIYLDKPYLGASADGIGSCDCHEDRVVEIKCTYKHRDQTVFQAARGDNGFFITTDGKLKRSHRYFSQVQLEMLANGKRFCDFVVFTNAGLHNIDSIPFDQQFCDEIVESCDSFFYQYLLPEIVSHQILKTKSFKSS